MRINIAGNAGSGKTTLAKALGEALDLPVASLDGVVWKEGWVTASKEERTRGEQGLIEPKSWIIEGVSKSVRKNADFIVFLDIPRHICLLRCLKRNLPYLFKSRPELPDNCPEILILPSLIKLIWLFPTRARNVILQSIDQQNGIVIDELIKVEELVAKIILEVAAKRNKTSGFETSSSETHLSSEQT
ncbi:topology modulation protein [Vibrio sp. vnigr-6D03]|uniref:topology modulation protein n=1 Tax=Vibrio sp. vnigr-6D03 TaxID=2058088 RepID=UPI000C34EEE3|nr:topology modulation protein [Vibrio sp. vnigr-6D03]PKF77889.1 topology modulation protein [Vibrio sp. vnigr-6D03]